MSDVEIEYTPEQDWLSDAGKESVVWVRKEPRDGAMTVTEVGMRNEAGGQFTRLPAQMADLRLLSDAPGGGYFLEVLWIAQGRERMTQVWCSPNPAGTSERRVDEYLAARFLGGPRHVREITVVRTLRREP